MNHHCIAHKIGDNSKQCAKREGGSWPGSDLLPHPLPSRDPPSHYQDHYHCCYHHHFLHHCYHHHFHHIVIIVIILSLFSSYCRHCHHIVITLSSLSSYLHPQQQECQQCCLQFTSWPDYGTPDSALSMLQFLQCVREKQARCHSRL